MAQTQVDQAPQDSLTYHLSDHQQVSYVQGQILFQCFPNKNLQSQENAYRVLWGVNIWKRLKQVMSQVTAQLKARVYAEIALVSGKHVEVKEFNGYWKVNLVTMSRSGHYQSSNSVYLSEDEWDALVTCEPNLTRHIETPHKKPTNSSSSSRKRPKTGDEEQDDDEEEHRPEVEAVMWGWVFGDQKSKERFFSQEQAIENCKAFFPTSSSEIKIDRITCAVPNVYEFLRYALAYWMRVEADQAGGDVDRTLSDLTFPHEWMIQAHLQMHLHVGIAFPRSKAVPIVDAIRHFAFDSGKEHILKAAKQLDMSSVSPFHLLCRNIALIAIPSVGQPGEGGGPGIISARAAATAAAAVAVPPTAAVPGSNGAAVLPLHQ